MDFLLNLNLMGNDTVCNVPMWCPAGVCALNVTHVPDSLQSLHDHDGHSEPWETLVVNTHSLATIPPHPARSLPGQVFRALLEKNSPKVPKRKNGRGLMSGNVDPTEIWATEKKNNNSQTV